jgi:hypothetical protein
MLPTISLDLDDKSWSFRFSTANTQVNKPPTPHTPERAPQRRLCVGISYHGLPATMIWWRGGGWYRGHLQAQLVSPCQGSQFITFVFSLYDISSRTSLLKIHWWLLSLIVWLHFHTHARELTVIFNIAKLQQKSSIWFIIKKQSTVIWFAKAS